MTVAAVPPRSHQCSICSKVAPWSDEWTWYGSYRQIDDGEPVVKLCSASCKAEFSKRRKLASLVRAKARQEAALIRYGKHLS
jgi:predicted nucleic acid-binding Zn ribbon protein